MDNDDRVENDDGSRNVFRLTTRRNIEDKEWQGSKFTTRRSRSMKNTSKHESKTKKEKYPKLKIKIMKPENDVRIT